MLMIRTYSELSRLKTFEERFEYLKLNGRIGEETFGIDRILNQQFYKSKIWLPIRDKVIYRDLGCDLGFKDYEIFGPITIHHLNQISRKDILEMSDFLLNPEFLVCSSTRTHRAIHFGDENLLPKPPVQRTRNDTCPWRIK